MISAAAWIRVLIWKLINMEIAELWCQDYIIELV
jgi:hypothetical protein